LGDEDVDNIAKLRAQGKTWHKIQELYPGRRWTSLQQIVSDRLAARKQAAIRADDKPWSAAELQELRRLRQELGAKFSKIASHFPH